ncbi:NACHT domain-containing protein [Streptomyces rubiginosohelvolus]|uniref:NACHT domain-containing protein n=1 Tax=Streptomyces rubiginosohelvolus TaxID=67362 RepID=UPI00365FF398
MLEVLAGKIAGAVLGASAGAAVRHVLPGPGAGLASGPLLPRLRLKKPTSIEAQDVERLAKHVAKRLAELVATEFSELPENEKQAATHLAADAILISGVDLWECDLNPEVFSQRVLQASTASRRSAGLLESAHAFCEFLIRDISVQLVQFITSWPTFSAKVELEQLSRLRVIADAVENINAKMGPDLRWEDLDFEGRYASLVVQTLNRLQIFGLDLADRKHRSYELSAAYITLSVAPAARQIVPTLSAACKSTKNSADADDDDPVLGMPIPSEADNGVGRRTEIAVSPYRRILLRGDAGSGKTTLLQWLAVNAANRSFPADLADWNSLVPFMLPLRRYANTTLPNPSQFFPVVGTALSEEMPDRWVQRMMRSGRALVLIDGVDELPDDQRDEAREWLRSLVATYPDAIYVITSRPAAAEVDWLGEDGFAVLDLLPMNQKDVEKFVEHWHDAARNGETDTSELALLNQGGADLLKSIREERQLRRLASNPLLCALLCTLNRDRHSQLPRDRMELYRAALDLLLLRRDRERKINYPEPAHLGDSQKKSLLGGFAHWLIRNGLTDASREQVVKQVGIALQSMPAVESDAASVFDYLLIRSGCLREPVPERVDFIHRTFQEYLAAARIVEIDDFDNLLANAHLDQWHEVFVMAVGHARPKERSVLLSGLIERGEREPEYKKRLHLLAAACLETATECDPPNVYKRVREITAELIPPRRITDAKELAAAGDMVIPLIPNRRLSANEAVATIRMAAIVGGDGALSLISRHARDKRVTVQREIRQAWEYFDAEEFARTVLSKNPENWTSMQVHLPHLLPALHHLKELREIEVACPVQGVEWMHGLENLERLQFSRGVEGVTFKAISAAFPRLRSLAIMMRESVASLQDLSGLRDLEYLNIFRGRGTDLDLAPFPSLPNLKRLMLHNGSKGLDFADLAAGAPNIEILWMLPTGFVRDLSGIEGLRRLGRLNISLDEQTDLAILSEVPHLEILSIRVAGRVDASALARCNQLRDIRVFPHNLSRGSLMCEFDLRPFIETGRPWRIQVSTQFGNTFIGHDHPAVRANMGAKARPVWTFMVNWPEQGS